jgi:hypothetical protein
MLTSMSFDTYHAPLSFAFLRAVKMIPTEFLSFNKSPLHRVKSIGEQVERTAFSLFHAQLDMIATSHYDMPPSPIRDLIYCLH